MPHVILFVYRFVAFLMVWPLCLVVRNHHNFKNTLRLRLSLDLPHVPEGDLVWFHGASLGEIRALAGLIEAVKSRRPRTVVCLSAMTQAGREAAESIESVDLVLPLPFDVGWIMRRYMKHLAPKALVISETEIWPNLHVAAQKAGIPVALVNARLSAGSFERYRFVKSFIAYLLKKVRVMATAQEHAARFKALGVTDVRIIGNMKFDSMPALHPERVKSLRAELGAGARPVFVAGSIREGEEPEVMKTVAAARREIPGLFCIVVPRHQGRVKRLTELAQRLDVSWMLRSAAPRQDADLLIVDTVGELFDLYGLAQAAFVGGSLVDLGGQNILEPIAWGVPTMHGPYMDNFLWALEAVCGNTMVVTNAGELSRTLMAIIRQPETYAGKARIARQTLEGSRGATTRYAGELLQMMSG
jgi:3-deoxy-D-manno-octulosonic-acid transferase